MPPPRDARLIPRGEIARLPHLGIGTGFAIDRRRSVGHAQTVDKPAPPAKTLTWLVWSRPRSRSSNKNAPMSTAPDSAGAPAAAPAPPPKPAPAKAPAKPVKTRRF